MKINTRRLWMYFIATNILGLALAIWAIVPERIFILEGQTAARTLHERRLAAMEYNLLMYEEHVALLLTLQAEEKIIIQLPGYTGALLTDVLYMLYTHSLTEHEFHASEQATHYAWGHHVTETRATIVADGNFDNISAFIDDVINHYRYMRIERIQISKEFPLTRLWLTFSIYEEW